MKLIKQLFKAYTSRLRTKQINKCNMSSFNHWNSLNIGI